MFNPLPPLQEAEDKIPQAADSINTKNKGEEIDALVFQPIGSHTEDATLVQNQGPNVDDNNEPAPPNVPAQSVQTTCYLFEGQS